MPRRRYHDTADIRQLEAGIVQRLPDDKFIEWASAYATRWGFVFQEQVDAFKEWKKVFERRGVTLAMLSAIDRYVEQNPPASRFDHLPTLLAAINRIARTGPGVDAACEVRLATIRTLLKRGIQDEFVEKNVEAFRVHYGITFAQIKDTELCFKSLRAR